MNFQGYRCDYCHATKGATNHWWMRAIGRIDFMLSPWKDSEADLFDSPGNARYEHICSESCATKALSKWMSNQALLKTE